MTTGAAVDVSVVVVSYNSRRFLPALLASVRAHTAGVAYEAIVVDNASSDGSADLVESEFPWARAVRRESNGGLSEAINAGVAASSGRCIAVLNPDVTFDHDVLTPLASFLAAHADAGVVAPKLLDPDGTLQLSCRAFPDHATALFARYSLLTRLAPGNRFSRRYLMSDFDHARTQDVDWVSGAALMFSRAAFDRVGGWDAGFFLFSEDVDFCKRVHDAGLRVVYYPHVWVSHRIGISRQAPPRVIVERHRSMWRYYRKHLRRNAVIDAVTAAGIVLRCGAMLAAAGVRNAGARLRR